MLHLKPLLPTEAPESIETLYAEIKKALDIDTVPLVFQYLGNYERYLIYMWEKIQRNLVTEQFQRSCEEVDTLAKGAVLSMETPGLLLREYVQRIQPSEKEYISGVVKVLDSTNIKLMLLTIGIRESIKGIYIGMHLQAEQMKEMRESMREDVPLSDRSLSELGQRETDNSSKMISPAWADNALMLSRYPDFLVAVSQEMENLQTTEEYLQKRVELEYLGHKAIKGFVQPLDCTYAEFVGLTAGGKYIDELLFLLMDTFPAQFPNLVLTTAVMRKALDEYKNIQMSTDVV